jgi:uncharacterized protein (TIRG00374 family)
MKKHLGAILRIFVSVGILAYLFNGIFHKEALEYFQAHNIDPDALDWQARARIVWSVGPQTLWHEFQKIDATWLAAAIVSAGIPAILGITRWRWILHVQGLDVKYSRLFSISFIGLFFNAFMLGSTGGDVIKAWYVAHETHHKKAEAIATVVVDRLIGLLALFIIALVMMAIYHTRVWQDPKLFWFSMATLGVIVFTIVGTFVGLWKGFVDKFPGLRAWLQRMPKYDALKRMVEAYRVYASHPVILTQTMLISFAVHFFAMFSIWCIGMGLAVRSATFADYFLYLPIINSVTSVPITISGFGVREGMYVKMFHEVGVAGSVALVMSLVGYLCSLFWSIVGGGFFLTHRKELPPTNQMVSGEAA